MSESQAKSAFPRSWEELQKKQEKYDQRKQWGSVAGFAVAAIACCTIVMGVTENFKQDALAIGAVLGLGAYCSFQYYQWRRETMETLVVLEEAEPKMQEILKEKITAKPEWKPLEPIWEKLHAGRLHHQGILVHITSLQYALASTLIISSLGGAVAAFFILPNGWDRAAITQKTLFLTFAVMAAYCQTTPKVLSLSSNLTIHLARYHAFLTIRWHVYRYLATGQGTDGKTQEFALFLNDLTQRLVELPPAPFGIDPSQVTSIAALAQQFSLSNTQSQRTDPAPILNDGSRGNANQPEQIASNDNANTPSGRVEPTYSSPNTHVQSRLHPGDVLAEATNKQQISTATDSDGKLPAWMTLADDGTITLNDAAQAVEGKYTATIQLTLADGQQARTDVTITVVADPSSATEDIATAHLPAISRNGTTG